MHCKNSKKNKRTKSTVTFDNKVYFVKCIYIITEKSKQTQPYQNII